MHADLKFQRKFLHLILSALLLTSACLAGFAASAAAGILPPPGNACLFNAPNGVVNGGLIGHIGWAFRDGTADKWTFGAAEKTGELWMTTGSWAQLLATFRQGTQYKTGPDYYRSYRCETVGSSNPTAAYNAAYTQTNNGYVLASNNCLTKAVIILHAYGATNLPNVGGINLPSNLPNTYYTSDLPSSFNWPPVSLTTVTIGVLLKDPTNGSYLTTNPLHKTRPLTLQVYNATNTLIYQSTVNATVQQETDRYAATIPLDWQRDWSPGGTATAVIIKVKLNYTLYKQVTGFYLINAGTDTTLPDTALIAGDINQDNKISIADYNLLMACYSDLQPAKGPCPSWQKTASDLNDDGYVNGTDYNIMLRILQNQGGG